MVDLSKFEAFDFREGVPYVSITNNGLTFNKAVVMKLGYPPNARLLVDAENQLFVIQPCGPEEEKSVQFYKPKPNGILSVRWNARDLINTVSSITGWDLREQSYRVNGELIPEQSIMLFDLKEAKVML